MKYKPGKQNALADALSRRPDYEFSYITTVTSPTPELIRSVYAKDDQCVALLQAFKSAESDSQLSASLRAQLHRFTIDTNLLLYCTDAADTLRIVVSHDEDLKYRVLYQEHHTVLSGHLGRDKTYGSVSQTYWWPKLYKWVSSYVRTCETC